MSIARELFTTGLETEREFRTSSGWVESARSVLNSSVDRSDRRNGPPSMADPAGQDPGVVGLVVMAHHSHGPLPSAPEHRQPGLLHCPFERRSGEPLIFTFDRHGLGR
jgi:hypothetical protein